MTFDIEKFRIKPGQMDLFDNAPSTPILGTITDRPRNRASKKLSAVKGSVDLIQRTIEDSATILKNLGCEYIIMTKVGCEYIIMTKEGRVFEHGELPARLRQQAAPATPKKSKRLPSGTYSSHYKPIIENLPVGEVVSIPFRTVTGVNLSVSGLNSAVTAWIATNWGTDSSTTHINRKTKAIEVLRLK
jgi:hypothetical protein